MNTRKYISPEAIAVEGEFNFHILSGSPGDGGSENVGYEDWPIGPSGVMGSSLDSLF
jgi:hypothetical protein